MTGPISTFPEHATSSRYRSPPQNVGDGRAPRIREEHGALLRDQLRASYREEREERDGMALPDDMEPSDGAYYEVALRQGAKAEKLERKRQNITVGATKSDPRTDRVSTVVFIPDESVPVLEQIFEDYATGELTPKGKKPPNNNYVEPIETIRRARLFSFWTDDAAALPQHAHETIWWEIWCYAGIAARCARCISAHGAPYCRRGMLAEISRSRDCSCSRPPRGYRTCAHNCEGNYGAATGLRHAGFFRRGRARKPARLGLTILLSARRGPALKCRASACSIPA